MCNCISQIDAALAERNTRITLPILLWGDQTPRAMVRTQQIATGRGKKKECAMFASFCPFCGEKYPEATGQ